MAIPTHEETEEFIRELSWSKEATDREKTLVAGNLRLFASWLQERASRDDKTLSIAEVENTIISAIEATQTPDKMGEQSPLWEKVYQALEDLAEKAK